MTEKITLADGSVYEVPDGFRQMDPQEQDAILRELIKQPPVSQEPSDDETDDEAPTGRGRELAEQEAIDYYTAQGIVPSEEQIDEYLQAGPAGTPNGSMEDLMATEEARAAGEPMPFDTEQAATPGYLDAYNKQREESGNAYLDKLQVPKWQSAMMGAVDGLGFGMLDEVTGALNAAIPRDNAPDMWDEGESYGSARDKWIDQTRKYQAMSAEQNPLTHYGSMVAGSLAMPIGGGANAGLAAGRAAQVAAGGTKYAKAAETARRIVPSAAAQGALGGFGSGEGGVVERLDDAAIGAGIGAGAGLALNAGIGKLAGMKTAKFMQRQKGNPYASYDAEIVDDMAGMVENGARSAIDPKARNSVNVSQINSLQESYQGRYKDIMNNVLRDPEVADDIGIDRASITQLKNILDADKSATMAEADAVRGSVPGDAVADAIVRTQRIRALTPEVPPSTFAKTVSRATDFAPVPGLVKRMVNMAAGGEAARSNAADALLKNTENYRRLGREIGPSGARESRKALYDLDAAVSARADDKAQKALEAKTAAAEARAAPKMTSYDVMVNQNILEGIPGNSPVQQILADTVGVPKADFARAVQQMADDPNLPPEVVSDVRRIALGYPTKEKSIGNVIAARAKTMLEQDGTLSRIATETAAAETERAARAAASKPATSVQPKGALSGYLSGDKALPKLEALDPINSGLGSPAYRDPRTGKSFRTDPKTGDTIEVNPGAMVEPAPVLKAPATLARPSTEATQLPLTTAAPKSMGSPAASQSRLAAAMGDMPAPSKVTDGVDTTLDDFAKANGMTDDAARNRIAMGNAYQARAHDAAKANRGEVVRSYNAAPKGEPERMVDVYSDGHHWQRNGDGLMNEGFVNDKFVPLSRDAQFPPRSAEEATVPMRPIDRPDNWEAGKNRWQEKANKRVDQFNTDIRFSDEARAAVQDAPEQIRDTYRTTEEAMDYVDRELLPVLKANDDISLSEISEIREGLHTIAKAKPYRTKAEFEAGTSGTGRKRSRGRPRAPQD